MLNYMKQIFIIFFLMMSSSIAYCEEEATCEEGVTCAEETTRDEGSNNNKNMKNYVYMKNKRTKHNTKEILAPDHLVSIGASSSYVNLDFNKNFTFKGFLWGGEAFYQYRPYDNLRSYTNLFSRLNVALKTGRLSENSYKDTISYIDVNGLLGLSFGSSALKIITSLFTGVGFRYIEHDLSLLTSINYKYNHLYIPTGLLLEVGILSYFSMGFKGIWMPQVFPTLTISPIGGARWVLKSSAANYLMEIPFIFKFNQSRNIIISLTPFYEYWQDGASEATVSGVSLGVPKNKYNFVGIKLNAGLAF